MASKTFPVIFTLGVHDGASAKFAQAVKKMRADATKITNVGKSLTTGVTLPILGMGAAATHFASKFHEGMSNVNTLIDSSVENIDAMGKSVLDLSKRVPVATEDLSASLYDVRSAGVKAADQFKVLEGAARLGVAGLGSTKEATDLVTSAINSFNLKGAEADGVYNTIFATVKAGKTTISGLAQGFGGVAGTVAAAGIKFDDYLSNVAAMTALGVPAAQAHTQLKAVISGLTRETKQSSKAFHHLGAKNFEDLIKQSGGLTPALERIKTEMGGDSAKMLELLGSTEALNAVIALTGPNAKIQEDALASMRSGVDLVGEAFNKQANTTAAKLQMSRNAVEASAISIGEKLAPTVERLADNVSVLVGQWDKLTPGMQNGILITAGLLAVTGPLVTAIGAGATAYTWLSASVVRYNVASKAAAVWSGACTAALWVQTTATTALSTATTFLNTTLIPLAVAAAPFIAMGAAVALVVYQVNELVNALGGIDTALATVGEMWNSGSWDIAGANDAVMNRKAKERKASGKDIPLPPVNTGAAGAGPVTNTGAADARKPVGGDFAAIAQQFASEQKVTVDFTNMPMGVSAETTQTKGPAKLKLQTGRANSGAL